MKSLPTKYNGVTFRSFLEARWAVFFDALSITWEYELQAFDLGELGGYLPDFRLPEWQYNKAREVMPLWIEIKPPTFKRIAFEKVQALSDLTGDVGALCAGQPSPAPGIYTVWEARTRTTPYLFRYYGQREVKTAIAAAQRVTPDFKA